MKYVLFYGGAMSAGHNEQSPEGGADGGMAARMAVFPEHKAYLDRFHEQGRILMVGTFANPMVDGSMGIFPTREDAEAFVAGDPFMTHGLVRTWRVMEWNESLAP